MKKLISIAIFTILAVTIAVIFSSTSPSNAQYPYTFSPSYPPSLTAPSQYPSYQNPYPSYQNPPQPPAANPAPSQYPSPSYQNPQQQPQNSPSQSVQQYQIPSSPTTNVTTSNSTNSSTTTVPRNTQFPPNQQQPQFPPFTSPNPPMSILIVITRVNNTRTGGVLGSTNTTQLPIAISPSSFSEVVTNAYANPDGYTLAYHYIRGSQMAININLQPGVFTISDQSTNNNRTANNTSVIAGNQSPLSLYTPTYSGDCSNTTTSAAGNVIGYGQINLGETKTCIITYNNKVNR